MNNYQDPNEIIQKKLLEKLDGLNGLTSQILFWLVFLVVISLEITLFSGLVYYCVWITLAIFLLFSVLVVYITANHPHKDYKDTLMPMMVFWFLINQLVAAFIVAILKKIFNCTKKITKFLRKKTYTKVKHLVGDPNNN